VKKILFIQGTPYASGYYRMFQGCMAMQKLGYPTDIAYFNTVEPYELTAKSLISDKIINLTDFNTVVFQMVWHEALNIAIKNLKSKGITTAMEVDDDYNNIPANNPSFLSFTQNVD